MKAYVPSCGHVLDVELIIRVVNRGDEVQVWRFLGCKECGLPWGPVKVEVIPAEPEKK